MIREQKNLGSFIRVICSDIIQGPSYSYADYLSEDPQQVLSEEEYTVFVDNMLYLRLMLFYALLIGETDKVKISTTDLDKTFDYALHLALQDNKMSKEDAALQVTIFARELENFYNYLDTLPKEILSKGVSTVHVCMYYAFKLCRPSMYGTDTEVTYVALINAVQRSVKNYFEKAFNVSYLH